jgi:hypothetical protein
MPHARRSPTFPRLPLAALLIAVVLALPGCGAGRDAPTAPAATAIERGTAPDLGRAIRAHERVAVALLRRDDVTATSVTIGAGGRPAILVSLARAGGAVPATLDGVPVVTEVVGTFHPWALTDRERPVPLGVSVGNANECLPGTVGAVVEKNGARYLLCANHVFARLNQAAIGEIVTQPARADQSADCSPPRSNTFVATLAEFEPLVLDAHAPNAIDAAIAELSGDTQVTCATTTDGYGMPSSTPVVGTKGLAIQKLGRGTGLTRGTIKGLHAKVKITYPSGVALMSDQLLTSGRFGGFGDSGALAVTDDPVAAPVGMVIGGGSNGAAVITPIQPILRHFGVTICGR